MAKKGFTLIELLVVVAIIVVLIAMLLPSLGRAREQAKSVVCLNNLRQMGIAIRMYADENNGTQPICLARWDSDNPAAATLAATQWWTDPFMVRLFPYLNVINPYGTPQWSSDNWRKAAFGGVFHCPSKQDYNLAGPTDKERSSYAMNAYNPYQTAGNYHYKKLNNLDIYTLVISDDHTGADAIINYSQLYDQSLLPTNHPNGHNMLFPGGDAQRVPLHGVDWYLKLLKP